MASIDKPVRIAGDADGTRACRDSARSGSADTVTHPQLTATEPSRKAMVAVRPRDIGPKADYTEGISP
jgi:hypothetical protein